MSATIITMADFESAKPKQPKHQFQFHIFSLSIWSKAFLTITF